MELSLYIYGSAEYRIITSSQQLLQSTWYHVAVVSRINGTELYVNGTLVASLVNSNPNTVQLNNQQRLTLTIGNPDRASMDNKLYTSICHFVETSKVSRSGVIDVDNLRFYSRALKMGEIQALAVDDLMPTRFFFD